MIIRPSHPAIACKRLPCSEEEDRIEADLQHFAEGPMAQQVPAMHSKPWVPYQSPPLSGPDDWEDPDPDMDAANEPEVTSDPNKESVEF